MEIQINDKKIPKKELIKLIAKNKLQAIVHIRSMVNIGLKDAKEIVDNLDEDPNYYDHAVVQITERSFTKGEAAIADKNNKLNKKSKRTRDQKVGNHVLKDESSNKKLIFISIGIFIFIVLYFFII